MKQVLLLFLLLPIMGGAQNKLSIDILGVKTSDGQISVAVYDQADGFLKFDKVFKSDSVKAEKGKTRLSIEGLPNGEYALAIFHDENSNNQLDTNWLGIPKEAIGFSNARMKTFGPPCFKECSFKIDSNKEIQISL